MDNKKDNNEPTGMTNRVISKDTNPIDFFVHDDSFVFVYKKTEKLATALYMVTNLFTDSEPMKWTLRSKVSNLLSFIIGFKDILKSREDEFSHEVKTKVLEIVSLLEIASQSGLVSPMNFSILKSEFMYMTRFLSDFKKPSSHRMDLEKNFFEVSKLLHQHTVGGNIETSIGQENVLDSHKRNNRQNIIINLLKKKKEVTIHDIAEIISDCSEKTIQRELTSLIQAYIVKKTGQRRWSKYSLLVDSGQ